MAATDLVEVKADAAWDVVTPESNEKAWSERTAVEKVLFVLLQVGKVVCVLALLYLFIISLGLMGDAFSILGGPSAGKVFRNSEIFDNPVAGLVLGILATVLVQSSSTSTSIIISMTAAGLMEVKNAIPMIMGANIGTSVTNTIVSIGQMGDKDQYRRAFAGATVHDCFNLLTVLILLPLEAMTGVLRHIAVATVEAAGISDDQDKQDKVDFLKKITKPITSRLVQKDKSLVKAVAQETDPDALATLLEQSMIVNKQSKDNHLFMDTPMSDGVAGVLLLVVSLLMLSTCLILLVKTLQSVFRGRAAIWMKSLLNLEFKSMPMLGDYVLVLFGLGITILMQSSSITTSTLTPLVGIGLIRIEKMFPFTVGANIGTTVTGILSALAGSNIATGMTVALSHLYFNLFGTLIWFPIPAMRRVPIAMAKLLGNLAADLKWFPFAYIFSVFGCLPVILILLSLAGTVVVGIFGTLLLLGLAAMLVIVAMRLTRPKLLPAVLQRDPAWMPPSLMVEPPAVEETKTASASGQSADLGSGGWWQSSFAWGSGWFVVLLLVTAVPNGQWANLKYAKFDGRDNMGIGAWSSCSAMFTREVKFMAVPTRCTAAQLQTCLSDVSSKCVEPGFSGVDGANSVYENSWAACRASCALEEWESECSRISCSGSLHAMQCHNVTHIVSRPIYKTYGTAGEVAWAAGEKCRPNKEVLSNHATLAHAGNLGVAGIVAAAVGQILLLTNIFLAGSTTRDMRPFLLGSLLAFGFCWVMLLASWATFTGALGEEASSLIMDESKAGAVFANGSFRDIINYSGSYCFAYVIAAWLLTMVVMVIIGQRIVVTSTTSPKEAQEEAQELDKQAV